MTERSQADPPASGSTASHPPTDPDTPPVVSDRNHETILSFRYPSERRARLITDALGPEVGDLDESRSAATVHRGGQHGIPARGRDAADPDDGDEAGGRDGDDGNADTDAGGAVHVRIVADDLVALRAGIRSWSRLITVAEQLTAE